MKPIKLFLFFTLMLLLFVPLSYSQWSLRYATQDDVDNGTCNRTPTVAVLGEDNFVAIAVRFNVYDSAACNVLAGYWGGGYLTGRVGAIPNSTTYGAALYGTYTKWGTGADTVHLFNAIKAVGYPKDKLVFVANNDKDHNILVFQLTSTGVITTAYRMKTGSRRIYGIDVDDNGKVYVALDSATGAVEADIKVFDNFANEPKWKTTHDATPIKTIDLPASLYKGLAVDGSGKYLFIADYKTRKVIKYIGGPTTGYSAAGGYDFHLTKADSVPGTSYFASPIGLSFMRQNNILLIGCDTMMLVSGFGTTYTYGRIYLTDPNSGKLIGDLPGNDPNMSIIDQAKWNNDHAGTYGSRPTENLGTPNNVSGLASTYDVGYDDQGNVYSVSNFGWSVEKWNYFPILPTLTSVKELPGTPEYFSLKQNYPNPFNPSTNIEFSLPKSSSVTLKVYNMLGQEISTLINKQMEAGNYSTSFNAANLPSGTYFYSLQAGNYSAKMKMMLVK